jgi:hypothetical protein
LKVVNDFCPLAGPPNMGLATMPLPRWIVPVAALLSGLVLAAPAAGQTQTCRHIAAELQSLGRGGGQAMQQAAALRQQYSAIARDMTRMGCNAGGMFGPQPPAECQALRQRGGALAGQITQLEQSARQAGSDVRRRQLEDAYAANDCTGAGRIETVRAIYDSEAAGPRYATPTLADQKPRAAEAPAPTDQNAETRSGAVPVCVRTCDGFFFPVNYAGAEGQYADVCRASCPGAKAEMFWMPQGGDVGQAVSARGQAYSALPGAFRYRQAVDKSCTCKTQDESWGRALQQAEGLIKRKGDIIVTAETSERLANPDIQHKSLRGLKPAEPETTASVPAAATMLRMSEPPRLAQPLPPRRVAP